MGIENARQPVDMDRKPVANYFNKETGQFEEINSFDNAGMTHIKGTLIVDLFAGSGNNTHTFAEPVRGLYIKNKSDFLLTFTVNGITGELDPDEAFEGLFRDTFTSLAVVAQGAYKGHINE